MSGEIKFWVNSCCKNKILNWKRLINFEVSIRMLQLYFCHQICNKKYNKPNAGEKKKVQILFKLFIRADCFEFLISWLKKMPHYFCFNTKMTRRIECICNTVSMFVLRNFIVIELLTVNVLLSTVLINLNKTLRNMLYEVELGISKFISFHTLIVFG